MEVLIYILRILACAAFAIVFIATFASSLLYVSILLDKRISKQLKGRVKETLLYSSALMLLSVSYLLLLILV